MTERPHLYTGGQTRQLLPALRKALAHATDIEIAVSFIRSTGLRLIFDDLEAALSADDRTVNLTLLTSDYLCITDPAALKKLMLLAERGANIRLFECGAGDSFHMKAYIFVRHEQSELCSADAFVGSSNISAKALTDGLEWNYHLDFPSDTDSAADQRLHEVRGQFQALLQHEQVSALSYPWIERYQQRYQQARQQQTSAATHIDKAEPEPSAPTPKPHQQEALEALNVTRQRGLMKGLVVLATGMGKTFLAAFDALQASAKRVLFVAHREEILLQAEESFLSVLPHKRVGRYTGLQKDLDVDLLFASIQTLGRLAHLERFNQSYFDYIVVDEFHHAAANSYQRLLDYFSPQFLLGLTATPDRTDGSDINKLCDHNLVYRKDLFDGVRSQCLCPFEYFGIYDREVDYEHLPWRNGRFDPERLSNKLATLARARHAFNEWQVKAQQRTLAFCSSRAHADYMASYFQQQGVACVSVYSGSALTRSEALEMLAQNTLQVLFSVDLFNEGVDLPQIDTVMMLRPTESGILFLQQLGRGLRLCEGKEKLVVLDFVGNHHSFLSHPTMLLGSLFESTPTRKQLLEAIQNPNPLLPEGCFINYDLEFVDFFSELVTDQLEQSYTRLKNSLQRRPTLTEFWRSGASLKNLRRNHGSWWEFVDAQNDITGEELEILEQYTQWFRDLTITNLTKSYKLVLLQTILEKGALHQPVAADELSQWAKQWFLERALWQKDLPKSVMPLESTSDKAWLNHWNKNPIHFWCEPERYSGVAWFEQSDNQFCFFQPPRIEHWPLLKKMTEELVEWRLLEYAKRQNIETQPVAELPALEASTGTVIPYFPNIKIACGHFKSGTADAEEYVPAPQGFGRLSPERHFIARASGQSMNGGKNPIHDGDYLLLEHITSSSAGSISNQIVAIERQDQAGDDQYLLRKTLKNTDGSYTLQASNPDYGDLSADDSMKTFARLRGVIENPVHLMRGNLLFREEIPALFGVEYSPGNWNAGHVVLGDQQAQVLLVTLNKQGKLAEHQYSDFFIDEQHFHWQSQNSTSPTNKRGRELINHQQLGSRVYLFVREHKLSHGKGAPFRCYGEVEYQSHEGSKPMNVVWRLKS